MELSGWRFPVFQTGMFFYDIDDDYPAYRCGHTFTAVEHRLILFGGCTSVLPSGGFSGMTNGLYCYNALMTKWKRVDPEGEYPSPRAGHAAAASGTTLMIQGGISASGLCAGDLYALDITNADNITNADRFEWHRVVVQGEGPGPRFGHVMGFAGQILIVFGGKNGNHVLSDAWALDMTRKPYVWQRLTPHGTLPSARMYASGCGRSDGTFLLCGGRDNTGKSLGDIYELKMYFGEWVWTPLPNIAFSQRYQHATVFEGPRLHVIGGVLKRGPQLNGEAAVAVADISTGQWLESNAQNQVMLRYRHAAASFGSRIYVHGGLTKDNVLLGDFLVADISSSKIPERLASVSVSLPTLEDAFYGSGKDGLQKMVISTLLRPKYWKPPTHRNFFLNYHQVAELCHAARSIIEQEPTVLQLNIPIKVFGDIHGQFEDLMSLFKEYGSPSLEGDITCNDFLFLGDYVDRGAHSLETIILLLALKIEYPRNIHLIRGNHEARHLNAAFGFKEECIERMGLCDGIKAWLDINNLFDHLPLAALIEKKIFCMHGGLGKTVDSVEQVASIPRPIALETNQSMVVKELLWSDPTWQDSLTGIQPNNRGGDTSCFGPDIVEKFCIRNKIDLILRAHECVMDGFKRFAGGRLISVFSATNYCGQSGNAGAILVIGRAFDIVAKLIHPRPPVSDSEPSPVSECSWVLLRPNSVFELGSTSNS